MGSWLNIVLMFGLLLVSLQRTQGFRLPQSTSDKEETLKKLTDIIPSLQKHYNTLGTEWVGKSVFASQLDRLNSRGSCTCQAVLLEGMLNIYEEIFRDMSNKSEKKEVKTNLTNIMTNVTNVRKNYSEEQKVWRELQEIHSIKVKNATIQKGALNEFLMVFNLAY
ncbi:interferon gamma-related-like [Xyrauchen texanus]|uniref:interferon gamma-related-like n=1 Tax=Xyrauchen texanus TaxID=154827 RepID=UPI00224211A2|nr:interferon gamma-related-like [Xyrauchen texanus]